MIADCLINLGQPEEALKSLRQGLRRNRRPGVVHKRLGDVLVSLARFKEAIEEYRATVLRQPTLREKQPELMPLLEKAHDPEQDLEALAKQIQGMLASIAAQRRAERGGDSPLEDDNIDTPSRRRKVGARRFGGMGRGRRRRNAE